MYSDMAEGRLFFIASLHLYPCKGHLIPGY
jgi:hypothetical protein